MPAMPAVCLNCGTMFPSGLFFENSSNITLKGNMSGPCPQCGGMGRIPNGIFDFIGATIRLLAGPQQSVDDLRRLQLLIEDARRAGTDPSQVAAAIEEQIPDLEPLIERLLIPRSAGEFYAFLGCLVTVITLVLALRERPEPVTNVNIDRQVIQVVEDCWREDLSKKPPSQFPADAKQESSEDDEHGKPDP